MPNRIRILNALWCLMLPAFLSAENWPTTDFKAQMGKPNAGFFDDVLPIEPPLTPEIRADLEDYLNSVASYLEPDFPAPALQRTDHIEDGPGGPPAYLVYYYDAGDDFGTAIYAYKCESPDSGTIRINASRGFIKNDRISTKGYVDLAHEFFHAIQRSTRVGHENCKTDYGSWILEGQAEAFGQDMAYRFRNTASANPLTRWGGRSSYNKNLYIKRNPSDSLRDQAYQTSSFWRYLAEAYYQRKTLMVSDKPGPDLGSEYGTDYRYLADLMDQPFTGQGESAELNWISTWLKKNLGSELYRVYTDFVAVLAQYGRYRFKGSRSVESTEERWRNTVFGGKIENKTPASACQGLSVQKDDPYDTLKMSLDRVSTQCVELDIGAFGAPKTFDINVIAQDESTMRQVRLAMAGGQQVMAAAPMKPIPNASGFSSSWLIELQPGKKQYLLVTNVALRAGSTVKQDIDLHIGLANHISSEEPPPFTSSRPKADLAPAKPGPAGAKQARKIRHAQMVSGTSGHGTTQWSHRPQPDRCTSRNKWRVNCNAAAEVELTVVGPPEMGIGASVDSSGGFIGSLMEMVPTADFQEISRYTDYLDVTPGTKISLKIPTVDYGFSGTVSDALIWISGGSAGPDLVSRSPQPVSTNPPCAYGPPVGTVIIEEFSPHVLRGSYSARVIEAGSPRNVRTCPPKSVVKTISGSFLVTAPMMSDDRQEMNLNWMEEEMLTETASMLPPGMDYNPDTIQPQSQKNHASSSGSSNASTTERDPHEYSVADCKCTCTEFKEAMKSAQNMMISGGSEPDQEAMRLMSCMSFCAAKVSDCPF